MASTLAWPVRVEGGRFATVDDRTDELEAQRVAVLVATRTGERVAVPDYGTPDPVGAREYDAEAVQAAAGRWCPQAEIVDIDAALAVQDTRRLDVTIATRRRA